MTKEEYDRLGHITETGNCCICGKEYTDYGNSTWGIWTAEEEKMAFGENKRCCSECIKIVNEARRERVAAVKQGKIENILQDFSEVIYERRSKGLVEGGESIIRVYDNGLYRKILLPREKYKGERKDIIYGKELSAVTRLREFFNENKDIIDSIPEHLENPYMSSWKNDSKPTSSESVRYEKKLITGYSIFAGFPDEFFEGADFVRTPEKDAIFEQIRKNNDLHQEISKILESEYPLYKKRTGRF